MPGVNFIYVSSGKSKNKMTVSTYETILKKHVESALDRMIEKGYITKEDTSKLLYTHLGSVCVGEHSCASISKLFWHTYAKIIARARVADEPIVSEYADVGEDEDSSVPLKKIKESESYITAFTKPTAISDALCAFLGVPKGNLLSRSEVTTRVCRYAKEKALMSKQVIKADAPLRKLLALTESDELTFRNLQRFLKPHYV